MATDLGISAHLERTLRMQDRSQTAPMSAEDREATRLSRGVARHDPVIAGTFYDAWFDWCVDQVKRLTQRDEAFCLDVVQEAMLKAIRSMPEFRSHADMARWMRSVVRNAAIDQLRSEQRRAHRERLAGAGRHVEPEDADTAHRSEIEWLRTQMLGLTDEDLESVRIRFGLDGSLRQAADAAGQSIGQTHGRIRRLIERFRRAIRSSDHA